MTNFMNHFRVFLSVCVAALFSFSSCTNLDNTLGASYTPDYEEIVLGTISFEGESNIFETKLFLTDSIKTSNLTSGYMGREHDLAYGSRKAGFFVQYTPGYELDSDIFGYMPILDSVVLIMTPSVYSGDTSYVQTFNIYEVVDVSFFDEVNNPDSVFFGNFDMTNYLNPNPVFTFKFPDQDNEIYTNTTVVRLSETSETTAFMNDLMLETDYAEYEDYNDLEVFKEKFKGIYIAPEDTTLSTPVDELNPSGAIYSMLMEGSGLAFYGRNRYESDPLIVQDTIGMTYLFRDSDYEESNNFSLNTVVLDYDNSSIDVNAAKSFYPQNDGELTSTLRVSGMGGVVSEIAITRALFEALENVLETTFDQRGDPYNELLVNQARLFAYLEDSSYDASVIDPFGITEWFDIMPTSLALYSHYAFYYDEDDEEVLEGIEDYIIDTDSYSSYGTVFGGYINRTFAYYEFNIEAQVQLMWNTYKELKEEAGGDADAIDWEAFTERNMYLAPTIESLFDSRFATLQGMNDGSTNAPLRLNLTYTLFK
ncbi:MAG: DUF4270 family protein [Rikenellaceae bacterium]